MSEISFGNILLFLLISVVLLLAWLVMLGLARGSKPLHHFLHRLLPGAVIALATVFLLDFVYRFITHQFFK